MNEYDTVARTANATNNAKHQGLRLDRWHMVRDSAWGVIEPRLPEDGRVCLVGAGSCDDLPLARIVERVGAAGSVDLVDFDISSTDRALHRLPAEQRARVTVLADDVTGGSADLVLRAARDRTPLPDALPLPYDALGAGEYDLVIGDMLYTQLLHAGMLALDLPQPQQRALMRRYDAPLTTALVHRLQASARPGGHVVHIHDLACWASAHAQLVTLDEALVDPCCAWERLRRHDACDPHLTLGRIGANVIDTAWWRWPFEPNKHFLVRATVARADVGASSELGPIFRTS